MIKLNIDDVTAAGSVESAILEFANQSDYYASGNIGPTFSTSGPGAGWSIEHDASDFAKRALVDGFYYIDCNDGRVAKLNDDGQLEWTDESEIELVCPTLEETIENADIAAEMAKSVYNTHHSNKEEWECLVNLIQKAGEAFYKINEN